MNTELHLDVEPQNVENAHSNFEISTHENDEELSDRDMHNDFDAKRRNIETRIEPRLEKYVR